MLFSQKILHWFDAHGRKHLPWQQNPSPYRVWVSEIMLQQTQVATVIPYYERFIDRFPNITELAKAPIDDVFRLWAGLGYYARAKNLHKTAQMIQSQHQGVFPTDYETVVGLPGIGPSTAGAILAISTQQRYPILDGNVKRVFCRHFAIKGWPNSPVVTKKLWKLSEQHTPFDRVHHYTQAMMDLGATLCTRSKPNCIACPIATTCQAKRKQQIANYPTPKPKTEKPIKSSIFLLIQHPKSNTILLEKRPTKGIWGGLWSLPEYALNTPFTPETIHAIEKNMQSYLKKWRQKKPFNFKRKIQKITPLPVFRHTFTHFHLDIQPILYQLAPQETVFDFSNFEWHPLTNIHRLGIPAPTKRLLKNL